MVNIWLAHWRSPPADYALGANAIKPSTIEIPSGIGNESEANRSWVTGARKNLTFECRADKVAVAPDQPTPAHRAEIVERNAEFGRYDVQAIQFEAGTLVGDVADATWVLGLLASEEHQYVAIDPRAADGAALDVASGLEYLLERRHARLPHEENEAARRSMTPAASPC
jgi:hypothetical protein